jgi:histidinol-phosphatase (PHP family)
VLVDYHIHTPYCGHAQGKTIQYIETAIALGFHEIGFSDHLGRYYLTHVQRRRHWDWGMNERNITRYIAELSELRELYRDRITIKIGLEVDFVEGAEELLQPFVDHFAFDYLLGSIHCLPRFGWKHLADYASYNETEIYTEYFRCARAALRSRQFHSLAHLDFIWRYLRWPQSAPGAFFAREIAETIAVAQEYGCCIEVNANGFIWSMANVTDGPDPFLMLLDEVASQHVPITIGSDAHDPNLVGKSFGELLPVLLDKEITRCTIFSEGVSRQVEIG